MSFPLERRELPKTMRAILENGDRIADDAQSLWEMDRFPSAFALCVLAQEEYAKAFLVHLIQVEAIPWNSDVHRVLSDHKCKQLFVMIMDFLYPDVDSFAAWLDQRAESGHNIPRHIADALNIIRHEKVPRQGEWSWTADGDPPCDVHARRIADGLIDREKQSALYVAISKNGRLMSTPKSIDGNKVKVELGKTQQLGQVLARYDDSLQPLKSIEYEKIFFTLRVLFELSTIEEYNRQWWAHGEEW